MIVQSLPFGPFACNIQAPGEGGIKRTLIWSLCSMLRWYHYYVVLCGKIFDGNLENSKEIENDSFEVESFKK